MLRIRLIWLFASTFTTNGFAQNLVANGDFEFFTQCPTQPDQGGAAFPWGTGNSYIFPEYFNSCANLASIVSVPVNADSALGYQQAHSGNGYAGINVYQDTNPFPIDYLQTQLTDSLDSGKYYCLTFYTSLLNNCTWGVDAIGAYFAKQPSTLCSTFTCVLTYTPQVSNPAGNILLDTINWMKIEGCFQAQGGEKYMIIGNFKDNANTQKAISKPGGFNWSTYYYIDDVSLYEDSTLSVKEDKVEDNILIFPNPADNRISIQSKNEISETTLLDMKGKILLKTKFTSSLDVSNISSGIYLIKCSYVNGEISYHKLSIVHK
jgi:Secretion system C-terminal sorting domain